MSFRIHVSAAAGPASLYVTAGSPPVPFPAEDWRDFPVIVLAWWLDDLATLRERGTPVCSSFMNGPYAVELSPDGDGRWLTLRFLRRTTEGTVEAAPTARVQARDYARALIEAASAAASDAAAGERDRSALRAALRPHAAVP